MNVKILVFILVRIPSINLINNFYSTRIKIIPQTRFEVPIDTHLIESLTNVRSLIICSALCDRHVICRTADYDSTQKICRLFKTTFSVGTFLFDPTTTILALNYCTNEEQIEPDYICTRSGSFTVQEIFDQLSITTNTTLSTTDRGVYANMYGVYTTGLAGYLSFFTYTGVKTIFDNIFSEITNINSISPDGLATVQYYNQSSIIYNNIGNSSQPELVPVLYITLSLIHLTLV